MTGGLDAHLVVVRDGFTLDVALRVPAGTTTVVVGPNGAGKSTAVHVLAGLVPLSAGRITLAGEVLDEPSAGRFVAPSDRHIGLVPQDLGLFPHLDVVDNVAFGLAARRVGKAQRRERARRLLAEMGLEELSGRRPAALSGGQAQRVALARALAIDPKLLLLDEPLSALDVATRPVTRRALREHLAGFAAPRVIVTHDPVDVFVLADEVVVIEAGRVVQAGAPGDLQRRPATAYVAELVDRNRMSGTADGGTVLLDAGPDLTVADSTIVGPVLVAIAPAAVSLHRHEPEGSPRNVWATTVADVLPLGDRVRVVLGAPLPLRSEITAAAAAELAVAHGVALWASVKATEIELFEA